MRVFLALSIGCVLIFSAAAPLGRSKGEFWGSRPLGRVYRCGFKALTGLPCPGCGMTRSFVSFGHGRWRDAFLFHPFGPALFVFLLAFAAGLAVPALGERLMKLRALIDKTPAWSLAVIAAVAAAAAWAAKLFLIDKSYW